MMLYFNPPEDKTAINTGRIIFNWGRRTSKSISLGPDPFLTPIRISSKIILCLPDLVGKVFRDSSLLHEFHRERCPVVLGLINSIPFVGTLKNTCFFA